MKRSTLQVLRQVVGDGVNNAFAPLLLITNANAPGNEGLITLVPGANSLTTPPNAKGLILVPPTDSTNAKEQASSGISLPTNEPWIVTFLVGDNPTIDLTSAGTEDVYALWL